MNIEKIFCSFVCTNDIVIDNHDKIINYCKNIVYKDSEYIEHNTNQTFFLDKTDQEMKNIYDKLNEQVNNLNDFLGLRPGLRQHITESWINIGNNKNISYAHNHPNRFLSGVLYINVSSNSELRFMTPVANHNYIFNKNVVGAYNTVSSAEWSIKPHTGLCVIFPSWLYHFVNTSLNDTERISLAFNTWIE